MPLNLSAYALPEPPRQIPEEPQTPADLQEEPQIPANLQEMLPDIAEAFNAQTGVGIPSIKREQVEDSVWQVEQTLSKNHAELTVDVDVGGPSPEELQPQTPKEKTLHGASTEGAFDLRGKVGRLWQDAKACDPQLAADYTKLGRQYGLQREFRMKWCRDELEKCITERTKTMQKKETDLTTGEYLAYTPIFQREGGDSAAAEAARNYIMACLTMHKNKKMFKGRQWVQFNKMTRRVEFLYLKTQFVNEMSEIWAVTVKSSAVEPSAVSLDDKSSEAKTPGKRKSIEDGEVETETPPKAKAKSKASAKQKAKQVEESPSPSKDDDDVKKELAKLRAFKTVLQCDLSAAEDLIRSASADAAWSWAKQSGLVDGLQNALGDVRKQLDVSQWWVDWKMMDAKDFSVKIAKSYLPAVTASEVKRFKTLEPLVLQVRANTNMLKSMQKVRTQTIM